MTEALARPTYCILANGTVIHGPAPIEESLEKLRSSPDECGLVVDSDELVLAIKQPASASMASIGDAERKNAEILTNVADTAPHQEIPQT